MKKTPSLKDRLKMIRLNELKCPKEKEEEFFDEAQVRQMFEAAIKEMVEEDKTW